MSYRFFIFSTSPNSVHCARGLLLLSKRKMCAFSAPHACSLIVGIWIFNQSVAERHPREYSIYEYSPRTLLMIRERDKDLVQNYYSYLIRA